MQFHFLRFCDPFYILRDVYNTGDTILCESMVNPLSLRFVTTSRSATDVCPPPTPRITTTLGFEYVFFAPRT